MVDTTTPLLDAIRLKSENCVLRLLQSGADPNQGTRFDTPLHCAARIKDCEKIIDMLLQYGARPGLSVLLIAFEIHNVNVIEKLLKHGADPIIPYEAFRSIGSTLHLTVKLSNKDRSKICELLIKHGVEVDSEDSMHRTALMEAVLDRGGANRIAAGDVIETLLQYGARPCYGHHGRTPLQHCFNLSPVIVESMVKYAALQVNHSDSQEMDTFFQNFTQDTNYDREQKRRRKYLKFAQECMTEINTLKQSELVVNKVTLFDFAVSQGLTLKSFLENTDVFIRLVGYLSFTPLPIYHDVIMKKIDRKSILSNTVEASARSEWKVSCDGKNLVCHTYIIENIGKYLPREDLFNLFLAFSFA